MLVLIDIDGTIADNSHREHLIQGHDTEISDEAWDAFFDPDLVLKDAPIQVARATMWLLKALGADMMHVTGRDESLRGTTKMWLGKNDFPTIEMRMRSVGDTRSNREVKTELVADLSGDSDVLLLDDDARAREVADDHGFHFMKAPECWRILYLLLSKGHAN